MKRRFLAVVLTLILCLLLTSCSTVPLPDTGNTGGTLTQEASVDEGDIIKTYGDILYKFQTDGLFIYRLEKGVPKKIAFYNFNVKVLPQALYVTDSKIIILYEKCAFSSIYYRIISKYLTDDRGGLQTENHIEIIDKPVFDGETPVDLSSYANYKFETSCEFIDSRFTTANNTIYYLFKFEYDIFDTEIESQPVFIYEENDVKMTFEEFKNPRAVRDKDKGTNELNTASVIVSFDLSTQTTSPQILGLKGVDFKDFYMTDKSCYVIANFYSWISTGCYSIPYYSSCISQIDLSTFTIKNNVTLFEYIIYDRRAIKEFDDAVFVTATKHTDKQHYTTVISFDKNTMEVISQLTALGEGEDVKSVAYEEKDGKRYCYITTFKDIDPLFLVDITDPQSMQTLGYVEMPGYSAFMLPVGDYMISLGYDGSGLIKVDLYKTQDEVIKLIDQKIYTALFSNAIKDPNTIMISDNMFAFCITDGDVTVEYCRQELKLMQIVDEKLVELGTIINIDDGETELFKNYPNYKPNGEAQTERLTLTDLGLCSLIIEGSRIFDNFLYVISDGLICSYQLTQNDTSLYLDTNPYHIEFTHQTADQDYYVNNSIN